VSLDDWILALHLLAAFAFVGAIIGFWAMVLSARRIERPDDVRAIFRLNPYLTASVTVGSLASLVFGVWLAVSLDAYEVWDGWVIAGIVLWAVATGTGQRAGATYHRVERRAGELLAAGSDGPSPELRALARTRQGLVLHTIATIAAVLVLADMIWKPGA
jgi:uncharacterized membrane protein